MRAGMQSNERVTWTKCSLPLGAMDWCGPACVHLPCVCLIITHPARGRRRALPRPCNNACGRRVIA